MRLDNEGAAAILAALLPLRLVRPIVVANPAAGQDVTVKVPGGCIWEVLSIRATLTTSAVVANRRPALRITDADGNEYQRYPTRVDIPATTTADYNWITALGYEDTANPALYGLPALPFPTPQSWQFQTVTSLLDVGDQWSNVRMVVREWAADRIAETVNWTEDDIFGLFGFEDARRDQG